MAKAKTPAKTTTSAKVRRVKLDLGCGETPMRGFRGIDLYTGKTPKDRVDLFQFPYPWADESIDAINCSHFVEHFPAPYREPILIQGMSPNPRDWRIGFGEMVYPLTQFVEECWRILKPGGQLRLVWPSLKSTRAFMDWTHCYQLPPEAFILYTNRDWRQANHLDHKPYPVACNFLVAGAEKMGLHQKIELRSADAQEDWATFFWEAYEDNQVLLVKAP